jgi:hypothetical protein
MGLVVCLHQAGEDDELAPTIERMSRVPGEPPTLAARAYAAGALGDAEALEQAAAQVTAITSASGVLRALRILNALDELRAHGRRADAQRLAAQLAAQIGAGGYAASAGDTTRWMRGELLYRAERWAEARALVDSFTIRHPRSWPVLSLAGRAAARPGDTAAAQRVADVLASLTGRELQGAHLYARAQIAAILGQPRDAVRLLHEAVAAGVTTTFDGGMPYLGHHDMDLESIRDHPAFEALRRPKG